MEYDRHNTDWITQIPLETSVDDNDKILLGDFPVVKLTYPNGKELFAVTRAAKRDDYTLSFCTDLHLEINDKIHSRFANVPLGALKRGSIVIGPWNNKDLEAKVEFAGFAGDKAHLDRKWSYIYSSYPKW